MAAPEPGKASKTYLEALSSYTPWGSRNASPRPTERSSNESLKETKPAENVNSQRGGDHKINTRRPLSLKKYPRDCPKLGAQWFHAVDVPKRKPDYVFTSSKEFDKPPPAPKKWNAFSKKDSKAIEAAFQSLPPVEDEPASATEEWSGGDVGDTARSDKKPNLSIDTANSDSSPSIKVPVNEDYLFDVDIEKRELGPAYWLGPIYEVRRGTWFYAEGAAMRPCDENLATQLEEGYLKTKPWRTAEQIQRSKSQGRPTSIGPAASAPTEKGHSTSRSVDSTNDTTNSHVEKPPPAQASQPVNIPPMTHRLFGPHSNWIVTYQGSSTAWLLSDDFISRMSSTVFSRFAGGAGTKVVRGYTDTTTKKAGAPTATTTGSRSRASSSERSVDSPSKRSSIPTDQQDDDITGGEERAVEQESRLQALERQMSNLVTSNLQDPAKLEEAERQREEDEIENDYRDTPNDPQDREIEHLVLISHGIGQRLGARFESFNFIHDVNELRKTLKAVYGASTDLQALNNEVDKLPQNCRIQVLPVCWRHLLDFPMHSVKHNRKDFDLADADEDDDKYPSLQDITVEGVPALRNIVADLALDILLYQTPAYKDHIARIVAKESNRIYKLFMQRNSYFKGRVSMIGHSLGSAILFDILCAAEFEQPTMSSRGRVPKAQNPPRTDADMRLDFDVQSFFCLGSPIGLFNMLNGKTIAGRGNPNAVTLDGSVEGIDHSNAASIFASSSMSQMQLSAVISSPKCEALYNVFHPSDPIAYRLEPLISSAMTSMKPQNLPYVKKSWLSAAPGTGITAIPSRVTQTVSGLFSSMSSGITSGLTDRFIHRSLGLSAEDAARLGEPAPSKAPLGPSMSQGAGTNITAGGVISAEPDSNKLGLKRKLTEDTTAAVAGGQFPPTLIESELETLYAGFHKRQKGEAGPEDDRKARVMRREEAKVRALNSNGRVDYSIQEGAFDISFLAGIASHLAYWNDEDISHFLISQLLSKRSSVKRSQSTRSQKAGR